MLSNFLVDFDKTSTIILADVIKYETINDDLEYNCIPQWDSTAHMALIAKIDGEFGIMMDIDDIIDMSSMAKSKEILNKYDVSF